MLLLLLKKMWMRKEAKVGKMIVASIMMSYDVRPSLNKCRFIVEDLARVPYKIF